MQISHEEAHRLIQFHVDGELKTPQSNLLTSHLQECAKCQQYAATIEKMESVLRPLLHRNWDQEPLPLSIGMLMERDKYRASERIVVATRIAALAVVFLAFFASAWNFTRTSRQTPTPLLQNVPVIPTPFTSTMTVGTEIGFENCTMLSYLIQKNDTLASIASQFAVPAQQIRQINAMQNDSVNTGQVLSIPICSSTPANPTASHTTTFTPVLYTIATTPDG
jgi:hypothetical protein